MYMSMYTPYIYIYTCKELKVTDSRSRIHFFNHVCVYVYVTANVNYLYVYVYS